MKKVASRIAVVVGAVAVSVGLMGAVAAPANAGPAGSSTISGGATTNMDSSWGR